jgi:hypothetical protein
MLWAMAWARSLEVPSSWPRRTKTSDCRAAFQRRVMVALLGQRILDVDVLAVGVKDIPINV